MVIWAVWPCALCDVSCNLYCHCCNVSYVKNILLRNDNRLYQPLDHALINVSWSLLPAVIAKVEPGASSRSHFAKWLGRKHPV